MALAALFAHRGTTRAGFCTGPAAAAALPLVADARVSEVVPSLDGRACIVEIAAAVKGQIWISLLQVDVRIVDGRWQVADCAVRPAGVRNFNAPSL